MQIIVLGMHRSGTSATARLINMMGAYFGPENISLHKTDDNPKGFWERRDVMRINASLIHRKPIAEVPAARVAPEEVRIVMKDELQMRIHRIQ